MNLVDLEDGKVIVIFHSMFSKGQKVRTTVDNQLYVVKLIDYRNGEFEYKCEDVNTNVQTMFEEEFLISVKED